MGCTVPSIRPTFDAGSVSCLGDAIEEKKSFVAEITDSGGWNNNTSGTTYCDSPDIPRWSGSVTQPKGGAWHIGTATIEVKSSGESKVSKKFDFVK